MRPVRIMTDSNSDLSREWQEKLDVDFVYAHVEVPDKGELPAYVDWDWTDRDAFFADLKRRPEAYATSPPNVEEFAAVLRENAKKGFDTIAITISGGISGSIGFLTKAAEQVMAEYPDAKIGCVDSRRFGPAIGFIVKYACELRDSGLGFDEILEKVEKEKNCVRQAGWLDDLTFVARKGRISHAKAFFGTLAGVKPIGEFDENGLTTVLGKASGAKAAFEIMLQYIEKTIVDPQNAEIFMAHTCRAAQAEAYKKMIEERIKPKAVYVNEVHASVGINIGPGLLAAYYFGTPISSGLEEEKKLFEEIQKNVH